MRLPSKDFLKKASMIGTGHIIGQAIAFVFLTIIAIFLKKEEYGEVRYILSAATLFSAVIAAGLPATMTRYLARYNEKPIKRNRYFSNIMIIFLIMLIVTEFIVIIIFIDKLIITLVVIGFSVPLLYMGTIRGLMQYRKFSIESLTRNLVKIVILFAIFYVIGVTDITVLLIYSFGGWITILILESIWPAGIKFNLKYISKKYVKEILRFSIPVFITTFAFTIAAQIPVIIIALYWDYETVAIFGVAITLTLIFGFIPMAVNTITMPKIAAEKNTEKRIRIFLQSSYLILITAFLLWILTIIIGKWGLRIIFGEKYILSYWPLIILALGSVFLALRNTFESLWVGGGRPINSVYDTVGAGLITTLVSFLLIPNYGSIGASIAFVMGWLGACLISVYFLIQLKRKKFNLN
jgi:O-antigen/teichoic acid export membrane protein